MELITLQFQTPQDLSGFRKMIDKKIVEINIKELIITCHCDLPDVANAMNYFGAKVIPTTT